MFSVAIVEETALSAIRIDISCYINRCLSKLDASIFKVDTLSFTPSFQRNMVLHFQGTLP